VIIDMAANRGAFIDQSQSLNIHIAEPTFATWILYFVVINKV